MKKFTLFFALLLMISVSAMAQNPLPSAKALTHLAVAKPIKHACVAPQQLAPQGYELADINIEAESFSADYYEADHDWYCILKTDEYKVFVDFVSRTGDFAGTYTMRNCLKDYTFVSDVMDQEDVPFETVTIVTTGEDPTIGCEITIDGTLTNGRNVHAHYLLRAPEPATDTLVVAEALVSEALFMSPDMDGLSRVMMQGEDRSFDIRFQGTTGIYKLLEPTCVCDESGRVIAEMEYGEVTVNINQRNVVSYDVEMVCSDRVCYKLHATYQLTTAGEESIICHDMEIESMFDFWYFVYGSNDQYLAQVQMFLKPAAGVPTDDIEISLMNTLGETIYTLRIIAATFTEDEDGGLVLDAKFLASNMIVYTLHIDFQIPGLTASMDLGEMNDGELMNYIESRGVIQILSYSNSNDLMFTIVLPATELKSGHFTELSSEYKEYCYLEFNPYDPAKAKRYPIYRCGLNLTIVDEKHFHLGGWFQAGTYDVGLAGVDGEIDPIRGSSYDVEDEDVDVSFTEDDIHIYEEEDGYTYFSLINQERQDVIKLMFYTGSEHLKAGTYPINASYETGTVQAGVKMQQSLYPSYYAQLDDAGQVGEPIWCFNEGTVTVFYLDEAEEHPAFEVNALNTWMRTIHITYNWPKDALAQPAQNVEMRKALENGHLIIYQGNNRYDVTGLTIE